MKLLTLAFSSPAQFMSHYSEARSNGAVFFRSRAELEPGEEVVMEISFEGLPNRILARAKVLVVEPSRGAWLGFHPDESKARDFLVALARAEQPPQPAVERSFERFPASLPVDYRVDGASNHTSLTEDVGAGGVFIRADVPPPVGTPIQLVIGPTHDSAEFFTVDGEVAWVRPGGVEGFGVRFDSRNPDAGRLRKLLRRASETGSVRF